MALRKLLKLACPIACAVCLAAGYASAGQWVGLALAALVWGAWHFGAQWPPTLMLIASVTLAAAGLVVGASALWMLPGAALALASWDLAHWDSFLADDLPAEVESRLERKHYTCLALALVPALLAAAAGQFIRFQIPFGVLVAVALLALLGLDRIWAWVRG
jgi:hypothetical protein